MEYEVCVKENVANQNRQFEIIISESSFCDIEERRKLEKMEIERLFSL